MEAIGQLTGGLAHDFNNLLTGISGSLELLEARLTQGQHAGLERYISAAQRSARRAAALTQRLLAFFPTTDARSQTDRRKPVDCRCGGIDTPHNRAGYRTGSGRRGRSLADAD
ncbi:MAG TPA: histidine kinase dimerization/phospho-acceptor domain-containing protein [Stellaceae bacterium]|nr:histidine kinase dimerization/phospho-acceptor domain-containing protein [Stellaceae bacterium]